MPKEIEFVAVGMCSMSVCSSLSLDEIVERANKEHPTGISSKWAISKDKTFANGIPTSCPCERNPETHNHYLLNC